MVKKIYFKNLIGFWPICFRPVPYLDMYLSLETPVFYLLASTFYQTPVSQPNSSSLWPSETVDFDEKKKLLILPLIRGSQHFFFFFLEECQSYILLKLSFGDTTYIEG